jgi:GTPase SAR1 family protein
MRDRQGFILVYDITNPASVDDLNDLHLQILRNKLVTPRSADDHRSSAIPLVLVGNKLDLAAERKVSHHRGKELSKQWKCPHYETSAKTRTNVDEIFYDLVGQIIESMEEAVRSRKASGTTNSSMNAAGKETDGMDGDSDGAGCCCVS